MRIYSSHDSTKWKLPAGANLVLEKVKYINGTIILWKADSGESITILGGHEEGVEMLSFSPSGKILASCHAGSTVYSSKVFIWDLASGKVKHTIQSDASTIFALAFSPDEKVLKLSGTENNNPNKKMGCGWHRIFT